MIKLLKYGFSGTLIFALLVWFGLPILLKAFGLHPHYDAPDMSLDGRRALIIATSHDTLGEAGAPIRPEHDLRAAGAVFESEMAFRDSFADHVVIDGRIVNGQNQNSATGTAVAMMQALTNLPDYETMP